MWRINDRWSCSLKKYISKEAHQEVASSKKIKNEKSTLKKYTD